MTGNLRLGAEEPAHASVSQKGKGCEVESLGETEEKGKKGGGQMIIIPRMWTDNQPKKRASAEPRETTRKPKGDDRPGRNSTCPSLPDAVCVATPGVTCCRQPYFRFRFLSLPVEECGRCADSYTLPNPIHTYRHTYIHTYIYIYMLSVITALLSHRRTCPTLHQPPCPRVTLHQHAVHH